MTDQLPRGVRLNNPGNIEHGAPWQGLADLQPDERFCSFVSAAYGFRAQAMQLIAYKDRHGCDTVRKIVSRWCPPSDPTNWTADDPDGMKGLNAYIATVTRESGFEADEVVNAHLYDDAYRLCRAMTVQEQGSFDKYFTKAQLDQGLLMAGAEGAPMSPVRKVGVVVNGSIAAVSSVAPAAVDAINTYKPMIDQGTSATLKMVFGMVAAVFAVLAIYNHVRSAKSKS